MLAFPAVIPTVGLGALTTPEDISVHIGTEKEKNIFAPRSEDWQELGEQCAEQGIGVNLFFANSRPVDLASICEFIWALIHRLILIVCGAAVVSSVSGGQIYFHPRFDPARDGLVLHSELRRLVQRTTGYSCLMKVRCSQGPFLYLCSASLNSTRNLQVCASRTITAISTNHPRLTSPSACWTQTRPSRLSWNTRTRLQRASLRSSRSPCCIRAQSESAACACATSAYRSRVWRGTYTGSQTWTRWCATWSEKVRSEATDTRCRCS